MKKKRKKKRRDAGAGEAAPGTPFFDHVAFNIHHSNDYGATGPGPSPRFNDIYEDLPRDAARSNAHNENQSLKQKL
jgi:hypothetical protein